MARLRRSRALLQPILLAAIGAAAAPAAAQHDWEVVEITTPERRPAPQRPAPPPALPREHLEAPPLTFDVVTRRGEGDGATEQSQRVLRTARRVLIEYPALGQQWLFEQNPVDARRVHGKLIIPDQRLVIEYNEADLADSGIASSWLDVMSLGMSPAAIAAMTATGETTEISGFTAHRYLPPGQESRPSIEIWWSEDLLMPLRIVQRSLEGVSVMEIRDIRRGADARRLEDPSEGKRLLQRLFTKVDVSDWREDYHGNHIHIAGLPCGTTPTRRPAPAPAARPAP